jgi:hypothetical protein
MEDVRVEGRGRKQDPNGQRLLASPVCVWGRTALRCNEIAIEIFADGEPPWKGRIGAE